jgi:tetratricopeptide (TPR) repeat protein
MSIKVLSCWKVCIVFLFFSFLLSGCQQMSPASGFSSGSPQLQVTGDESEYGCAYFYFLWGRQAELGQRYEEAMEAYEKALICDPQAYYIMQKMPVLLLRMGKSEEAISWLSRYLDLYPDAVGSRMLLAKIFINLSRFDDAAAQYRLIYKQNPDDHSSLLLLGEMYLSQNKFAEAEKILQEVLEGDDHTYGAHILLGQAYRTLKQYDLSLQHYELALAENWSVDLLMEIAELFLQQEYYEMALEQYDKVLESEEDNERARASKVHVYLLQKNNEKALEELYRLREFSDNPNRVDLAIAKIYIGMNQPDKAFPVLKEILEAEEDAEARFLLGYLYFQQEKYETALVELDRIPVNSISYRESVYLRVRIYRTQEKIDQAVLILEEALAAEKGRSVDMYIMLAVLYQQQDRFDASREIFSRGIAAYPNDSSLLYEFGLFLDSRGFYKEALETMQRVILIDTDNAAALNYIGYTWADKGINLEKALEYISRAVELKPENGYIRDSLGWIYFRLGRLDEALDEIEKALEISGDDPSIYEHLGDVHQQFGNLEKALQAYRKSLELSNDDKAKSKVEKKIEALEQID